MYLYAVDTLDANNDHVELTLVKAPDGMVLDRNGLIRWVPSPTQLNDNEVEIHADDGHGGRADLSFVIRVGPTVFNESPRIVSSPSVTGTIESPYNYNPRALDSDGDLLVWSLNKAPRGMSIDAELGTIYWIPDVDHIGLADVSVLVTDAQGGRAAQSFTITVRAINVSPAISTVPPTQGGVGQIYNYAVRASDADGDTLGYTLARAPVGMTIIASTGLIQWTPNVTQVGSHSVKVLVEDGKGGTATQIYNVNVVAAPMNRPPIITTNPVFVAAVGLDYSYDANAKDADGDSLTFQLLAAPAGMSIDAISGVIIWTPVASQFGTHRVVLAVSDRVSIAAQRFVVRVESTNRSPTVHSTPEQFITPGLVFRYDVNATDPDGDTLTYRLSSAPLGMAIDTLGRVTWSTSIADIGTHSITIEVTDPFGASTSQNFELIVSADVEAPRAVVAISRSPAELGSEVTFLVSATDNVGVEGLVLIVDGNPLPVDPDGRAVFLTTSSGTFDVVATAIDAAGNTAMVSTSLEVIDTSDANAPEVAILSPSDEAVITRPVDVIGTSNDENLLFYSLEVAVLGSASFFEIARGTTAVVGGVLGTLDPTILQNETYVLRLTAVDMNGKSATVEQIIHVEGDLKLGNFRLSFTDLTVPVFGVPITVLRTYDTLTAGQSGNFGFGWRLEFRDMNLRTSVAQNELDQFGIFNSFKVGSRVYVTLPGGERQAFTFQPKIASHFRGSFLGIFEPRFVPDPGVKSSLTVSPADLRLNRFGEAFDYGTGLAYNPASGLFGQSYLLTTKDGTAFEIDGQTGQLTALSDPNNNTLRFNDTGIVGPQGIRVIFERDPQGRITSVVDPAGQRIRYQYDVRGDLIAVTDRMGNKTQFVYRSSPKHYLDKVIDPLGRTGVRTEYDAQGRLSSIIDAAGNPSRFSYDPTHLLNTVTDPLGNTTAVEYDARGNTVRHVDALGGTTLRTFDADNNMLKLTDPLGRITSFTYNDRGDPLTQTDPLGNTSISTYQAFTYGTTTRAAIRGQAAAPFTRVKTSTDPLGNTTMFDYVDDSGVILSTTDAAGNVTSIEYEDFSRPLSAMVDSLGNVSRFETQRGLVMRQLDPLGHAKSFTYDTNGNRVTVNATQTVADGTIRSLTSRTEYDAEGRITAETDVEGGITRWEYDAAGNKVAMVSALGHRTVYRYDNRNLLVETVFPDDTLANLTDNPRTKSEYDAAFREVARVDELGRRTEYQYDSIGRLARTIYPDGTVAGTEYDAAGQITAAMDERGNRTEYRYDAAGQQSSVRDALGNETTFSYDDAGRRIAEKDALGHITRFDVDSRGIQTQIVYADGSKTTIAVDNLGQAVAKTDQLNRTTRYEYDAAGRLTAVVDALGQRTEYRYDEAANRISQKDASGHVTRYEYDGLGREVAKVLPMGQRSKIAYDPIGNVKATTDFNGVTTTFAYDSNNRLTNKTFANGTLVTYAYEQNSLLSNVTDARGTTAYSYDNHNRLLSRTEPDGALASYTYDAVGNRTSVTASVGGVSLTTNYTFDPLNRLASATDPNLGVTRYDYNAVSNLVRAQHPNGTTETRDYDDLNRLVLLENRGLSGVISSHLYTLSPTGRRDSVVEQDGRRVDYTYDALDRLTREAITDSVFGDQSFAYTYDEVGNRLTRNDSVAGSTEYTYDANDLLLTEKLDGEVARYSYDNNGNTLSRAGDTDQVIYTWDYENRLIAVDTDGDETDDVSNVYDDSGNRVSQTAANKETRFLVDTGLTLAQVLLEYLPSGLITASYVYGDRMISQTRDATQSFYHADGLGSTRALTNIAGGVVNTYTYEAFGRVIRQTGSEQNRYLFAGEQRDSATGLDYLRARFLDVGTGRFMSSDSFSGLPHNPSTLHKFAYTGQNPINFTDPSGHSFLGSGVLAVLNTLSSIGSTVGRFKTSIQTAESLVDFLTLSIFGISVYRAVVSGDFAAGVARVIFKAGDAFPDQLIQKIEFRSMVLSHASEQGSEKNLVLTFAMDFAKLNGKKPADEGLTGANFRFHFNVSDPKKSDLQIGTNLHIRTVKKFGVQVLKLALAGRLGVQEYKLGLEGTVGPGDFFKVQIPLVKVPVSLPGKSPGVF